MKPVSISKTAALDLDRLIHLLVTASSGGGKTWALLLLLERALADGVHQVILDWEGEFANLRERGDYVLVGKDGDLPLDAPSAALLAQQCLEQKFNLIVDMSEAPVEDRHQFAQRFLHAFIRAPRDQWHDVLLVIDEAHKFCPQKDKRGETSPAKGEVVDLAAVGRKRGFRLVLATQRLAKLDKDTAGECNAVLVGKHNLPEDRERAVEVLGVAKGQRAAAEDQVRKLKAGSFFALGEAFDATDAVLSSVEEPRTKPPARGAGARKPPAPRAAVLRALEQLRDLPKRAREEEATLGEMQVEIQRLEREVVMLRAQAPEPVVEVREVEVQVPVVVVDDGDLVRVQDAAEATLEVIRGLRGQFSAGPLAARGLDVGRVEKPPLVVEPSVGSMLGEFRARPAEAPQRVPVAVAQRTSHSAAASEDGLGGPHRAILTALARLHQHVGVARPSKAQVAAWAGYSPSGGAFNNPVGQLRSQGLVDKSNDGTMALTSEGQQCAGHPARLLRAELQQNVLGMLGGPEQRILSVLLRAYPKALSKEDLAAAAGYGAEGGAFNNPRGRLHTMGLVTYPGNGLTRAADFLFPRGA